MPAMWARTVLGGIVRLGLAAGALKIVLGLLAPVAPRFEILNHFRPFALAAAIGLLGIALLLRHRRLVIGAGVLTAATLGLFLLPFAFAMRGADGPRSLRVVTFNLWLHNPDLERALSFLRSADADVVVLQEIGPIRTASFLPRLKAAYPHMVSCAGQGWRCDSALLAKRPFIAAGAIESGPDAPPMLHARFAHDGLDYEVVGVHVDYPFHPERQARHIDGLIARLNARSRPLIIAGDFNLTPFSWKLTKLAHRTGLRRAATLGGSWSTLHALPTVLIDHVFASPEFGLVAVRIGPNAGSDHLPVTADLAIGREGMRGDRPDRVAAQDEPGRTQRARD